MNKTLSLVVYRIRTIKTRLGETKNRNLSTIFVLPKRTNIGVLQIYLGKLPVILFSDFI